MIVRRVVAALAVLLGLSAVYSSTASAQYPPTTGTGTVSAAAVVAGGCVTFSGTGFAPGSPVEILAGTAVVTTVIADPSGNFTATVCPTTVGDVLLTGRGADVSGAARTVTAEVTVLAANAGPSLPSTGAGSTLPVAATGAALLALGALIVFTVRRRRVPQLSS